MCFSAKYSVWMHLQPTVHVYNALGNIFFSFQHYNEHVCMYTYLLKVAPFDIGIFDLSEVGKAVVVTRVRLQ